MTSSGERRGDLQSVDTLSVDRREMRINKLHNRIFLRTFVDIIPLTRFFSMNCALYNKEQLQHRVFFIVRALSGYIKATNSAGYNTVSSQSCKRCRDKPDLHTALQLKNLHV